MTKTEEQAESYIRLTAFIKDNNRFTDNHQLFHVNVLNYINKLDKELSDYHPNAS